VKSNDDDELSNKLQKVEKQFFINALKKQTVFWLRINNRWLVGTFTARHGAAQGGTPQAVKQEAQASWHYEGIA